MTALDHLQSEFLCVIAFFHKSYIRGFRYVFTKEKSCNLKWQRYLASLYWPLSMCSYSYLPLLIANYLALGRVWQEWTDSTYTDLQWVCWAFPHWIENWKCMWCVQLVVFIGYDSSDWPTTHLGILHLWKICNTLCLIQDIKKEIVLL